jgi:hypothetical protein
MAVEVFHLWRAKLRESNKVNKPTQKETPLSIEGNSIKPSESQVKSASVISISTAYGKLNIQQSLLDRLQGNFPGKQRFPLL